MPPNVLLVVLDAARRDHLEPYGASPGSTPCIAQLASRGRAHEEVYSTACWTVPSHSSIFTGLMPRAAGLAQVRSPAEAKPIVQAHRERMLPQVMHQAGYRSIAASTNVWVSPASGYDTGFDDFEAIDSGRHGRLQWEGRLQRATWMIHGARSRADDGARQVEQVLGERLAASEDPFFCFVNLLECHSPYLPPRPYGGRFSLLRRMLAADDARRYYTLEGILRVNSGDVEVPARALARARRMYAASIRYMDDWLARMLERLDAAGKLDGTLVVVISDHGENLGENGLIAHGLSLDNRLIHVPFVAAGPGCDGTLSSLASLPRFVAEAAGIERHPYVDEPPAGIGVAQFDPPASADDPEAVARIEAAGLADRLPVFTTPMTCAVAGEIKLLRRGEREEVYDLSRDPLETAPTGPEHVDADRLAALRAALEHPSVTARREATTTAPASTASEEELRDLEERMKMLGYM